MVIKLAKLKQNWTLTDIEYSALVKFALKLATVSDTRIMYRQWWQYKVWYQLIRHTRYLHHKIHKHVHCIRSSHACHIACHMTHIHHLLHIPLNGGRVRPRGVTWCPFSKGHYVRGLDLHTWVPWVPLGFEVVRDFHQGIISHLYVHDSSLKSEGEGRGGEGEERLWEVKCS